MDRIRTREARYEGVGVRVGAGEGVSVRVAVGGGVSVRLGVEEGGGVAVPGFAMTGDAQAMTVNRRTRGSSFAFISPLSYPCSVPLAMELSGAPN